MEGDGLVEAVKPRSTLQWVVLFVVLLGFGAAVGYAIRAFAEPSPNALSSTDKGFLLDMVDHHEQAVTMGIIAADRASDPTVRQFAQEVVIQQRWEMGVMEAVLGRAGLTRGTDPERPSMAWMGMAPVASSRMPGMATDAEIAELRTAPPDRVNTLFLQLMRAHHLAGADMADYEVAHGSNSYVKDLAASIARNQRSEIAEYDQSLQRLQSTPAA